VAQGEGPEFKSQNHQKKKKGLNGEKCYVNFSSRKSEGERKTVSDKPTMRYCQQTCAARNV
jgi:hypothetical protein